MIKKGKNIWQNYPSNRLIINPHNNNETIAGMYFGGLFAWFISWGIEGVWILGRINLDHLEVSPTWQMHQAVDGQWLATDIAWQLEGAFTALVTPHTITTHRYHTMHMRYSRCPQIEHSYRYEGFIHATCHTWSVSSSKLTVSASRWGLCCCMLRGRSLWVPSVRSSSKASWDVSRLLSFSWLNLHSDSMHVPSWRNMEISYRLIPDISIKYRSTVYAATKTSFP